MIVVSDLMGTLTTGSPVLGLVDWVRHNQSKWQARWYLASILPAYFLAKRGLIDWQPWAQSLMVNSLSMIRDATPQKFDRVSEWLVEANLWKKRREDVIRRLSEHAGNGAQVYIASSVHEPGVAAFARRIGAQAIGSPVEFVNGRVRFAGELVADEKKIEQVLSRVGVERLDFAYGDTVLDIPLLEHADYPVAVYPDGLLREAAQEHGWEIMGEKASYP
jgi:phosphoserine phosphatase